MTNIKVQIGSKTVEVTADVAKVINAGLKELEVKTSEVTIASKTVEVPPDVAKVIEKEVSKIEKASEEKDATIEALQSEIEAAKPKKKIDLKKEPVELKGKKYKFSRLVPDPMYHPDGKSGMISIKDLLELPKAEKEEALAALINRKQLTLIED